MKNIINDSLTFGEQILLQCMCGICEEFHFAATSRRKLFICDKFPESLCAERIFSIAVE